MMTRAKVLLAAALLVGSATACSDVSGNNVVAEGSYFLTRVTGANGSTNVPYSYVDPNTGHTIQVQSDQFLLTSDGRYSEQQLYGDNGFSTQANETGSWSQSGNTVFFSPNPGGDFGGQPYQGTVRNDRGFGGSRTLTISISGTTAIYTD
ncbi:MAG: hypothetical protein ACR2NS_12680 [Gemmatimonadaceae bacterium]